MCSAWCPNTLQTWAKTGLGLMQCQFKICLKSIGNMKFFKFFYGKVWYLLTRKVDCWYINLTTQFREKILLCMASFSCKALSFFENCCRKYETSKLIYGPRNLFMCSWVRRALVEKFSSCKDFSLVRSLLRKCVCVCGWSQVGTSSYLRACIT